MLKLTVVALLSLSLMVVNALAQEPSPDILPGGSFPGPLQPIPAGQVGDKEKEPNKPDQGEAVAELEWQPRVRLVLNEPLGSQAVVSSKRVLKERTVPVLERDGGRTVHKSVQERYAIDIESVTEGATIIDCDVVSLKASSVGQEGKEFAVQIEGKLILRNGTTRIEAENARLADGKLILSNANVKSPGLEMKSEELVLTLNVERLRIGDVTEPEEPTPNAAPIPTFNSDALPHPAGVRQSPPVLPDSQGAFFPTS